MRKILHSTAITSLRPAMFRDRANLQDSPWTLRDCNIHVLFEKCTIGQLLKGISDHNLVIKQVHRVHLMLEALRERQRMFTSCG